ncbi:LysR substrate-binding domain-containing protein [Leisingera thetidis]|uniref:LysR substrate-binding domain-containing protein n=1 Tax=Leisingera thetidis TaxID=2930199 RepID=UPI0021F7245A|nr:LysR family transcriptional regulator [Leisingera thetidis]
MTNPHPLLHGLSAFHSAARQMSFTKAAEDLGVSQSAISHQIRQLEQRLKVQLFVRKHRQLALTEVGWVLFHEVEKGFTHFSRGLEEIDALKSSGSVRVDVTPRFALKWLSPRLSGFSHAFPAIKLVYHQSTKSADFAASDTDASLEWHLTEPPDRISHLLLPTRFSPICAPELMDGPNPLRQPSDIRNHTVLYERNGKTWSKWFEAAGCPGLTPAEGVAIDDGNFRVQAAMNGQGIDLGSLELLTDEFASGRLVQPFDTVLEAGGYYLTYSEEALKRPRPRLFIEWILRESGAG